MFGLTIEKVAVIAVIAVLIIGPDRLPLYVGRIAAFVRGLRDLGTSAKSRIREELGDDYDTIEWQKLDPRQYDPRRIVREALSDSAAGSPGSPRPPGSSGAAGAAGASGSLGAVSGVRSPGSDLSAADLAGRDSAVASVPAADSSAAASVTDAESLSDPSRSEELVSAGAPRGSGVPDAPVAEGGRVAPADVVPRPRPRVNSNGRSFG